MYSRIAIRMTVFGVVLFTGVVVLGFAAAFLMPIYQGSWLF